MGIPEALTQRVAFNTIPALHPAMQCLVLFHSRMIHWAPLAPTPLRVSCPTVLQDMSTLARLDDDLHMLGHDHVFSVRINDTNDHTDIPKASGTQFTRQCGLAARTTNVATFMTTRISSPFFNTDSVVVRGKFHWLHSDEECFNLIPSDAITVGNDAPLLLNAPSYLECYRAGRERGHRPTNVSRRFFGSEHSEEISGPIGQIHILGFQPDRVWMCITFRRCGTTTRSSTPTHCRFPRGVTMPILDSMQGRSR